MISKELVAASSEAIILSILQRGESYGYDIIKQVRESSGDRLQWTDGMLYPVLHRLEQNGCIESTWRKGETGRRRKYYRIVTEGKRTLEERKEQWAVVQSTLEALWNPQPDTARCTI